MKEKTRNSPKNAEIYKREILFGLDFSITRRLGGKIDKKLEEADILLRGSEFIVIVVVISVAAILLTFTVTLKPLS